MTPITTENPLLLPPGTRLLHIGPPKTGTTSVQYAFHVTRDECHRQGVHYAGVTHQPARAARSAMAVNDPLAGKPPSKRYWQLLLWEIRRASEPRVVISSESFAQASPAAIRAIVADLDPGRVHVVVTLRPLARILASHWQQSIQNGLRESFDPWLRAIFDEPDSAHGSAFWLRHRHDELVARWADVVGADNVTVVALDDADHAMVLRVFEQLTGLREHTLPSIDDATNRSMTLPEAGVIKAINERLVAERTAPWIQKQVVTFGAAAYMKGLSPAPGEPRILVPDWASDRAEAVAASIVEGIRASGVRVVGHLGGLVRATPGRTVQPGSQPVGVAVSDETRIPARAAAAAGVGIVLMSGHGRDTNGGLVPLTDDPAPPAGEPQPGSSELDLGSSLYLLAVVANRLRIGAEAGLHRVRGPIRRRPRSD